MSQQKSHAGEKWEYCKAVPAQKKWHPWSTKLWALWALRNCTIPSWFSSLFSMHLSTVLFNFQLQRWGVQPQHGVAPNEAITAPPLCTMSLLIAHLSLRCHRASQARTKRRTQCSWSCYKFPSSSRHSTEEEKEAAASSKIALHSCWQH